jgi:hypothetical protein
MKDEVKATRASSAVAHLVLVRPMKPRLALIVLLLCSSVSAKEADRDVRSVAERAARLMAGEKGLLCVIPKRADASKAVRHLAVGVSSAKAQKESLIVYCPDPELGKRIITVVFAAVRRDALRRMTIVCVVGKENDSYIRPVIEATGAKLYVQPLP